MSRPNPLRAWLQLFRAPNLLTVPGDPFAGYLLASLGSLENSAFTAIGACLCFYAGGLVINDLADLAEDRRERPERPLPSGAISVTSALVVAVLLVQAGLGLCALINHTTLATGGALLAAIIAYNRWTKRIPIVGALNMGLCRGLSMMIGATAVPHGELTYRWIARGSLDHLVLAVGIVICYIAAVTHLARFETQKNVPRSAKWLPFAALSVGAVIFLSQLNPIFWRGNWFLSSIAAVSALLFMIAIVICFRSAVQLTGDQAVPVPPHIGKLIRNLLLIQAGFLIPIGGFGALSGFWEALLNSMAGASVLVILWPISRDLSRSFYAS